MDDNTKKKLEEVVKRENAKETANQEMNELIAENRRKNGLIRICYNKEIEAHLKELVDDINNNFKKENIRKHIVMPPIQISGVYGFCQWISLLSKDRIEFDIKSLLSNDGRSFNVLSIEIDGVKKEVIGYGIIKDPKGIGYNFVFTYFNNECDLCLLENFNHAKPSFNSNSEPIEYNNLDLSITRIKIKSSELMTNIIVDKTEILKKIDELVISAL